MQDAFGDSLAELLTLLVTAVGSGVLAIGGAAIEYAAFGNLTTGHTTIGVWELVLGGILLYAGVYLLGYQRLLPAAGVVDERSVDDQPVDE